ncbi:hypothetical protein [Streptococcus sanguinis]|uniref:hypothetical protein n=1 Tax=Streptococcus sanguinis TaxID=1305 RepID=UPI001EE4020E|nr:hypothetical protein [Streptococcus sanguinis]
MIVLETLLQIVALDRQIVLGIGQVLATATCQMDLEAGPVLGILVRLRITATFLALVKLFHRATIIVLEVGLVFLTAIQVLQI